MLICFIGLIGNQKARLRAYARLGPQHKLTMMRFGDYLSHSQP